MLSCYNTIGLELLLAHIQFFLFDLFIINISYLKSSLTCYHFLCSFHLHLVFVLFSSLLTLNGHNIILLYANAMVKEWSEGTYPPWAHGPGYVVSHDIARTVYKKYKENHLKVCKILYLLKM